MAQDLCTRLLAQHASMPTSQGRLTVEEGLVLFTYMGTILLLICGPVHLPCWKPRWWTEKVVYAPVAGLVFVSLVNYFRGKRSSLVSPQAVTEMCQAKIPIILLIISFAYLSISLDISGFFNESAAYVVKAAKGDGRRLLVYIYCLCSFLTYFSSNDIVIISLTPLIVHIGDCSTIQDVVPLLITQFVAANTAAMGLLVGSPTNIILGDALDLSFGRYWVMMLLPTFVAVVVTLLMLLVVFVWYPMRGHVMVREFEMKTEEEREGNEREGEGETNEEMIVAVLVEEGVERGAASLNDELQKDNGTLGNNSQDPAAEAQAPSSASPPPPSSSSLSSSSQPISLMTQPRTRYAKVVVFALVLLLLSLSNFLRIELWTVSAISALIMLGIDLYICHCDKKSLLSFLGQVYARVPWAIAPFVLCMFILVRVLTDVGFTGRFAKVVISAAGPNVWTQSLVFGFVSSALVNILNDLPSSVLWANMLPALCTHYSPRSFQVVLHALLVGVNPGCYLTIIGKKRGGREGLEGGKEENGDRKGRRNMSLSHLHMEKEEDTEVDEISRRNASLSHTCTFLPQNKINRSLGWTDLAERHPFTTRLQALNCAQRLGLVVLWHAGPRPCCVKYLPGD